MSEAAELTIHIDGAARGNPGPAAWAIVVMDGDRIVAEECGLIGEATNNVAEYTALIHALERAAALQARIVHIKSDSELLVKQLNGEYRVRNAGLLPLYQQAEELRQRFDRVDFTHVYREQNKRADKLCNEALDGKRPGSPGSAPPMPGLTEPG